MLGKLFKYEFPAMGRRLGPLFIAWAAASVLLGLSIGRFNGTGFIEVLYVLIYVMVTVAVFVMFIMLIIQKYKNSLLGDEAYFNLTLPVSASEHIANKTLSALVWSALTTVAAIVSGLIIALFAGELSNIFGEDWAEFWKELSLLGAKEWLIIVEIFVIGILSSVKSVLAIYAAITIGHQAKQRTTLASIGAYIGLMIAESSIGNIFLNVFNLVNMNTDIDISDYSESQAMLLIALVVTLALSAAYFFICKYMMENKLNLN